MIDNLTVNHYNFTNMYTEEKKAAEFVLLADERILWAERRTPRWDAKKIFGMGIIVVLLVAYVIVMKTIDVRGICILMLLAIIAPLMLCAVWLREYHTVYLLTEKRAIIVEEAMWGLKAAAITVPLRRELIASCKRRSNGRSDYVFVKYTEGLNRLKDGFLNVQSVQTLETQLAALGLSLPKTGESRPLTQLPRPTPWESLCYNIFIFCYFYDYVKNECLSRDLRWWVYVLVGACALKLLQMILLNLSCALKMRRQKFYIFAPETQDRSETGLRK